MSAVGPQFHEFLKKLEENNDKLPTSITSRTFQPEFDFNNSTCYLCNGYYGPSFGEPVCVTCHAFLYPDIPSNLPNSYIYSEKTDDGDSGNDEPSELLYNDRRITRAMQLGLAPTWAIRHEFQNSLDSETSPEDESSRQNLSSNGGSNSAGPSCGVVPPRAHGIPSAARGRRAGATRDHSSGSSRDLGGPSIDLGGPSRDRGGPSRDRGGPSRDRGGPSGHPTRDQGVVPPGPSIDLGDPSRDLGGPPRDIGGPPRDPNSSGPERDGLDPPPGPPRDNRPEPTQAAENGPANEIAAPVDDGLGPAVVANPDDEELPLPPWSVARTLAALSTPRLPDNLAPGLVERLPSEVLLCMLSYLDDLSLCACALVCTRWWRLVRAQVSQARWHEHALRRWPLLRAMVTVQDWHKKYQSLVESCFCRHCLVQMCVLWQPPYEENAWRRNRLRNELKMLRNDPPEGCAATPLDPKCCHWQAMVTGPVGSPYEGGVFYLYIQVPYSYPMSPPVVRFLTRILHPNVSRHGDVGIDSVHHNWSLALTLSKVLISIQSLLTDPYTAVCMEPGVGEMYVQDRVRFDRIARRWTWQYAMHDVLPNYT